MASTSRRARLSLFGTEEPVPETAVLRAGPLECPLRRRQPAPHQARRGRGDPGGQLHRARPQLGHLQPRDQQPGDRAGRERLPDQLRRGVRATRSRPSPTARSSRPTPRAISASRAEGEALSDFVTNRTGFVVLHPVEGVSGAAVEVEHVDGTVEHSRFPELIDPTCPFMDIRALTHEPLPGRARRLPDGGRHLRDGGPAQLAGRLLQDLCPPARPALALHARQGREADPEHLAGGRPASLPARRRLAATTPSP